MLAVMLLCAATVVGRAEGYNASAGSKPEDMPSSEEGEQLMPQVGHAAQRWSLGKRRRGVKKRVILVNMLLFFNK